MEHAVGLVLDALYGTTRPPSPDPENRWWYERRLTNGMEDGLIEKVSRNTTALVHMEEHGARVRLPWQFYGTIVTAVSAVIIALIQRTS